MFGYTKKCGHLQKHFSLNLILLPPTSTPGRNVGLVQKKKIFLHESKLVEVVRNVLIFWWEVHVGSERIKKCKVKNFFHKKSFEKNLSCLSRKKMLNLQYLLSRGFILLQNFLEVILSSNI